MKKFKFILINSILSIIIVAAVVSIIIEVVWVLVGPVDYIPVRRLLFNFLIGLIIGTSVISVNLLSLTFIKNPFIGYILTSLCVSLILAGVYIHTGLTIGVWSFDAKWLIIFIISECITIPAVSLWRKQIKAYKNKLELKKAALAYKYDDSI